jgi:hypothetical protein
MVLADALTCMVCGYPCDVDEVTQNFKYGSICCSVCDNCVDFMNDEYIEFFDGNIIYKYDKVIELPEISWHNATDKEKALWRLNYKQSELLKVELSYNRKVTKLKSEIAEIEEKLLTLV